MELARPQDTENRRTLSLRRKRPSPSARSACGSLFEDSRVASIPTSRSMTTPIIVLTIVRGCGPVLRCKEAPCPIKISAMSSRLEPPMLGARTQGPPEGASVPGGCCWHSIDGCVGRNERLPFSKIVNSSLGDALERVGDLSQS